MTQLTKKMDTKSPLLLERPDVVALAATLPVRTVNSVIFNLAHAYARAADSTWKLLVETGDADFGGPAIICQTFAIELLLKFFLVAEHPDAASETEFSKLCLDLRGHRCVTLYDRLSASSRLKVDVAFAAARSPEMPVNLREALVALGDDPFFKWRYVYEGRGAIELDKLLLDCVTGVLGQTAADDRQRFEAARIPSQQA